ncbi:MAG: nucleoside triphosphate pyrophosphohydrolase family protein [Treponema porcinum]|uniref:nucleoside triphosphate pyrophosphohydrolase family protein n=1 Tax=Treponema porcinum TaxID=261392 RepID=UPI002A7FA47B|nr:nucleoside triphosphate pyrophosphohydrolase family protein [Treponema porcinum]MDY5047810.1 nucleoside triphosphate pyrophosphohydrolase family protein [Treponema porcinum]MDY5633961.1 nucleoside triphosphate pyrophosphohydrolase family protein [Treponema porcinum]
MTGNEYQKSAMRTCRSPNLNHAVFGLCSEAGEVSGIMQKVFQGHKFDKNHIVKELGDCLWMIAEACSALDVTFEEVMDQNIEKLKKRYPDGFEEEKSIFRNKNDI